MLPRICKGCTLYVPAMWSHVRNINVIGERNTIRYEIPMYNEDEMKTNLVSVYKSNFGNKIVVEFCIENIEQDASPKSPEVCPLS